LFNPRSFHSELPKPLLTQNTTKIAPKATDLLVDSRLEQIQERDHRIEMAILRWLEILND